MNRRKLIMLFHYGTGLMDALTGLCLLVVPAWTLVMMNVAPYPETPELISYLGVFVFSVGAGQFLGGRFPNDEVSRERWRTIWKLTSLIRFAVAAFVLSQVIGGHLEPAWIAVTFTDFTVASVFVVLLRLKTLDPS
ncbi:MAG: hypothetical protein QNL33_14785 [Akkermansiaceae bacterium]|jgi:hypothetical protein